MTTKAKDRCPDCGCLFETKFMIRTDHESGKNEAKQFWQATSRKSVVGWMKLIMDNFPFQTCTIYNLLTECEKHEAFWKDREGKFEIKINKNPNKENSTTHELKGC